MSNGIELPMDQALPANNMAPGSATGSDVLGKKEQSILVTLFFFSGFAALIYEVVFSKQLALTFGSTSLATYTVLVTYMGGMALGAYLGGVLASKTRQWLLAYLFCEFGIAIYCVITPLMFSAVQALYVHWAANAPVEATWLFGFRFGLGAMVLAVPTILMGVTLPLLVAYFRGHSEAFGDSVSRLYGANTFGAAVGALLAGYAVIPAVGIKGATLLAALVDLLVALVALKLAKQFAAETPVMKDVQAAPMETQGSAQHNVAWVLLGLTTIGAICLGLETLYMYVLAVVAGNSVYAFSLMLFAFLIGLGGGAIIVRRVSGMMQAPELFMVVILAVLGLCIALGAWQWESMADYFGGFSQYPLPLSFSARELIRGTVCVLAMTPPALLIGAFYPLAMEVASRHGGVRGVGNGATLNTIGNILGVLICGLVVLPSFGVLVGIKSLAILSLGLSLVLVWGFAVYRSRLYWGSCALAMIAIVAMPKQFDYSVIASGANVYFQFQKWGRVIDHAESIDGGLTSVHVAKDPQGHEYHTLTTNGKFQGNDSGEVAAQLGFAMVPLLDVQLRQSALVIGYGSGTTANTLKHAGFENIDIVDLSRDIVRLADQYFSSINERVSEQPNVHTYIADGRNYLLLQDKKYNLITTELSSIWFAGTAALYNQEFYQLVKMRLEPCGVMQQWVQLHHMQTADLIRVIASMRVEFSDIKIYALGGQGMMIGRNNDGTCPSVVSTVAPWDESGLKAYIASSLGHPLQEEPRLLLGPAQVDEMLKNVGVPVSAMVSTDNNSYLEYQTPKGNALDGPASFKQNMQFLSQSLNAVH